MSEVRRHRKGKKKPEWNDTLSDMDRYRLEESELNVRKSSMKSIHLDAAKDEVKARLQALRNGKNRPSSAPIRRKQRVEEGEMNQTPIRRVFVTPHTTYSPVVYNSSRAQQRALQKRAAEIEMFTDNLNYREKAKEEQVREEKEESDILSEEEDVSTPTLEELERRFVQVEGTLSQADNSFQQKERTGYVGMTGELMHTIRHLTSYVNQCSNALERSESERMMMSKTIHELRTTVRHLQNRMKVYEEEKSELERLLAEEKTGIVPRLEHIVEDVQVLKREWMFNQVSTVINSIHGDEAETLGNEEGESIEMVTSDSTDQKVEIKDDDNVVSEVEDDEEVEKPREQPIPCSPPSEDVAEDEKSFAEYFGASPARIIVRRHEK